MNASQERALERHSERYLIDVTRDGYSTSVAPGDPIDWESVFDKQIDAEHPLMVEIGSGTGEALAARAAAHPEACLVAFEVFERGIASTMIKLNAAGVENVRLVLADAVPGLTHLFAPESIHHLHVLFPDPWHKARHHKRRLINPEFARLAASRLRPAGQWHIATDWEDYALEIREVLDAEPALTNAYPGTWAPRPDDRPVTRYERRGLRQGRSSMDLLYIKADDALAA